MIDTTAATLAFRNLLRTLVVAQTGSTIALSATATGYARTEGSFLSDNFADGMEFAPAGFSDLTPKVIESVSDLAIITTVAPTVQSSGSGRSLTAGLPALRGWGNQRVKPTQRRPYIEESFVPGGSSVITIPADGGLLSEDGLYVIRWYGLDGKGVPGIRKCVDAVKALFIPGLALDAAGVTLRVRSDVSVKDGGIIPQGNGWAVSTITVPWWALSNNYAGAAFPFAHSTDFAEDFA